MNTLTELEQRLCSDLSQRRERLLADLAQHVAIPTGHNFQPGLDQYREIVLDRLRALGAQIQFVPGEPRPAWLALPGEAVDAAIPPVALATHRAHAAGPRILIAGHLDTVHDPGGEFRELTLSPDGRIARGPGAVDMKGGILIAVAALEALHECGIEIPWTFVFNSDEETGSFHSAPALRNAARDHDFGLVLEPALPDGSLVVERMGSGQFRIEVFGRAAHVGRDFTLGVSAVAHLARIIGEVVAMSDSARGLIVNVGPLQGGSVTNAVPDHAACWGNVRFANADLAHELGRRFDALASGGEGDALPRVVVNRDFNRPAKPCTDNVRALAHLARDAARDLGQKLPFASTGGVCDGNILQEAGLPTIDTLGVRGGNLHRTDEFVEVASLVERAQLFAILLLRLSRNQP